MISLLKSLTKSKFIYLKTINYCSDCQISVLVLPNQLLDMIITIDIIKFWHQSRHIIKHKACTYAI